MNVLLEAAVESLHAALAAAEGGAHRIELCTDLASGGTTPDVQLLRDVLSRVTIPVFVLVRPRAGDFVYTAAEHRMTLEQIERAGSAGAHGIVTGALTARQEIDEVRTGELIAAARPLPVTFHRAFDACHDRGAALERLIALGVDRVLTSGGAQTAADGAPEIGRLVEQARGRIAIVAGGAVDPDNVARLIRATRVREVHFSVKHVAKVRKMLQNLG